MPGKADRVDIVDFIDEFDLSAFDHVVDESDLWQAFEIRSQPAFAFINDDGTIERHTGRLGEAEITARIESLISS